MKRKHKLIMGCTFLILGFIILLIGIVFNTSFSIHSLTSFIIANIWFASIK